ncbi:MAG: SIS domain-containing protein [Syntrophobacteraceae bacterium]
MQYKQKAFEYFAALEKVIRSIELDEVDTFLNILSASRREGRQVFIFGNGGSGSTASHMTCDLNKGASFGKSRRFKVICLNDNIPTMAAYANDISYDDIFVEQLRNFLLPGDIVIGISGSGNSENVIRAIEYANGHEAVSVGLCGYDGGQLKVKARHSVHVNVEDMQKVEDVHLILGHLAMQILAGEE